MHIHAEGPAFFSWLPKMFGKRVVVTIHGVDWQREKWQSGFGSKFIRQGEKNAVKYADEIIVLSKGVQDYFKETYGRETHFIPNGVNRPQIREANLITEKFGLKKDSYILFLGRLVPEKGIRYLVEAFKNVKTDKKLVIAGGSSDTDPFMEELKGLAKDDERILFTGFVQGAMLDELYSNAYIYTLPSDLEGMPLSLLEAMSYGNCCLVSDIPECAEVVEDKALIFKKADVQDLQEKLQDACDHPQKVEAYKKQAADFICEKYNWDEVVKETMKLYRNREDYIDGKLHVFDKDWPELPFAHREHIGCTVDYVAGRNRYMGYLISLGIYSFKGVKVGLDCANGASWNIAKSVFDALGADTYVINNKPNGLNINNNAGSTHIEGLQKFVVEKGLDIGFAYDGDADRCLCVDEKGNVITGDHILYIYGCYMKERGKLLTNTVVTTVMSNFGLYKAFDKQGIGYVKTAVGDKYVYEYMAKNGCRIGGEQSGHIIFSKYASTGDGILTSLKMMEVMLAKKMPMSKLAEPLKIYPQVLENVRVTDKKTAQNDPAVQEAVKAVAEALGDTGRILVRESGTEPVVRVMVEAPDHDTCQKYVSQVVEVIKSRGYAV